MIYNFTRNVDATLLKRVLIENDFPELSTFMVKKNSDGSIDENNVSIGFTEIINPTREQELTDIMNGPELSALSVESDITILRQQEGIELYQSIYADLSLNATFPTVDSSIIGYDSLIKIRCMLKDGSGKSALRYLVKIIGPSGIFQAEQTERFRLLIREYCFKYRNSAYSGLTQSQYEAGVLDLVETAENI